MHVSLSICTVGVRFVNVCVQISFGRNFAVFGTAWLGMARPSFAQARLSSAGLAYSFPVVTHKSSLLGTVCPSLCWGQRSLVFVAGACASCVDRGRRPMWQGDGLSPWVWQPRVFHGVSGYFWSAVEHPLTSQLAGAMRGL